LTDSTYRHIEIVVDRSGSMFTCARDTEQGIAAFIAEQAKLPGRTTISLTQFDTLHDQVFTFRDIREDTPYRLEPRGGTALLDAIGFVFTRCGETLAAMPEDERPGEVIALIATDGGENSSREYTLDQVKAMITRQQEKYGWQVIYIGANQDAFQVGASLGVAAASTMNYNTTSTAGTFASASTMVSRGTQTGIYGFTAGERAAAVGDTAAGGAPTVPPA
jgi:hypothetical protein